VQSVTKPKAAARKKEKIGPKVPPLAKATGEPVCVAALFCDSAFLDKDNLATIIRTIDTITFPSGAEPTTLGQTVELAGATRLVILLKQGDAVGRQELPVVFVGPHGETDTVGLLTEVFRDNAGPHTAYNSVVPIQFVWRGEGWYWLEVRTKANKVLAKTPLRLAIGPSQQTKQLQPSPPRS
jgi:hypothetical protein